MAGKKAPFTLSRFGHKNRRVESKPMFGTIDKEIQASLLGSMDAQLTSVYRDREMLQRELGVSDAAGLIRLVRDLRARVASEEAARLRALAEAEKIKEAANEARRQMEELADEAENLDQLGTSGPQAVIEKMGNLAERVRLLTGTVASMEVQLISLYEEKERLQRELGMSQAADLLRHFHDYKELQSDRTVLEGQVARLYAGKQYLESELGISDPREVVALIRSVGLRVAEMHHDLQRPNRRPLPSSGGDVVPLVFSSGTENTVPFPADEAIPEPSEIARDVPESAHP